MSYPTAMFIGEAPAPKRTLQLHDSVDKEAKDFADAIEQVSEYQSLSD